MYTQILSTSQGIYLPCLVVKVAKFRVAVFLVCCRRDCGFLAPVTLIPDRMQRQLSISAMPGDDDDVEAKPEKAPAPRSSGKERSVHLIPLIIVLCFLLLFLCSHNPSPSDMSSFEKKAGSVKARLL